MPCLYVLLCRAASYSKLFVCFLSDGGSNSHQNLRYTYTDDTDIRQIGRQPNKTFPGLLGQNRHLLQANLYPVGAGALHVQATHSNQ